MGVVWISRSLSEESDLVDERDEWLERLDDGLK